MSNPHIYSPHRLVVAMIRIPDLHGRFRSCGSGEKEKLP